MALASQYHKQSLGINQGNSANHLVSVSQSTVATKLNVPTHRTTSVIWIKLGFHSLLVKIYAGEKGLITSTYHQVSARLQMSLN